MKNTIEAIAVGLVVLLSLGIIGLVVQYNMIDTDEGIMQDESALLVVQDTKVSEKKKVSAYLDKLEGYKDVDVKVDPKSAATNVNVTTIVDTEEKSNGVASNIGDAVQNVQKKENYVHKLEGYNPNAVVATPQTAPAEENNSEETPPEGMKSDPMSDIVNDIDSITDAVL